MTAVAEKVMESAMTLSPIERAELIERLFSSFDSSSDTFINEAWQVEVESRLDAYDAGKIQASPASEVFKRISSR